MAMVAIEPRMKLNYEMRMTISRDSTCRSGQYFQIPDWLLAWRA